MARLLYPLALDLHGKSVLVVGAGPVAVRKLAELLRCEALPTVIAPEASPGVERLVPAVTWVKRPFADGDEVGRTLVFACTNDPVLNLHIADSCARAGVLCNVADQAEAGSFHVPGVLRKGEVTLTISTGGAVPGLTRYLKRVLSEALGDEVADLAALLGRRRATLRTAALGDPRSAKVRALFESLPYRQLLDDLRMHGPAAVEASLDRLLSTQDNSNSHKHLDASLRTSPEPSVTLSTPGLVSLVGAGPGHPGLLTLAAADAIRSAQVIIHDRLIPEETLNLAPRDCLLLAAGKRGHGGAGESMRQDEIEARLIEHALAGRRVVRLKGGDPFIFGRGFEEVLALESHGIPWTLIPGLSSVTAGPAWAGIPLTHRGVARSFAVMSGMTYSKTNTQIPKADTLLLLMGLQRLTEIVPAFLEQGWNPDTPVAAVQDATLPDQRVCLSTLSNIAAETARRGFDSPTLFIIGEVVRLARPRGTP